MKHSTPPPKKIAKTFALIGFSALSILAIDSPVKAASITTFSDRATFNSAVGSTTLEDFTSTANFPIPNGILDSTSSFGTLAAGDIKAGATYTTPVGTGNYFNIDAGGAFSGGFLDGFDFGRILTISYNPLISGFGFDTNDLMPDFDITINFSSAPSYTANFTGITGTQFFGFKSDAADIQSVLISSSYSNGFAFAIDNHSFGGSAVATTVPEPFTVLGTIFGVGSSVALKRKLAKAQADKQDIS